MRHTSGGRRSDVTADSAPPRASTKRRRNAQQQDGGSLVVPNVLLCRPRSSAAAPCSSHSTPEKVKELRSEECCFHFAGTTQLIVATIGEVQHHRAQGTSATAAANADEITVYVPPRQRRVDSVPAADAGVQGARARRRMADGDAAVQLDPTPPSGFPSLFDDD